MANRFFFLTAPVNQQKSYLSEASVTGVRQKAACGLRRWWRGLTQPSGVQVFGVAALPEALDKGVQAAEHLLIILLQLYFCAS